MAKRLQRLRVDTAFYCRQQHFISLGNFARNDDFLRVKQVDGNGNGFTQVATNVLDVYAGSHDQPLTYLKKTDKTLWACGAGAYWGNAIDFQIVFFRNFFAKAN